MQDPSLQSHFIKAGRSYTQEALAFKVYSLLFLFHKVDLEMYLLPLVSPSLCSCTEEPALLCLTFLSH